MSDKLIRRKLTNVRKLMIDRCYNPSNKNYKYYGARNITICKEWRNSLDAFCDWALSSGYKPHLTIDRIDNNKGYSPNNCRWITMSEQQQNKSNCIYYTKDGTTQNIHQWCKQLGLEYQYVLKHRRELIKSGIEPTFENTFQQDLTVTNQRNKHRIAQYSKDGMLIRTWKNETELAENGFCQSEISRCCNGKRKTHKGFIWKFV